LTRPGDRARRQGAAGALLLVALASCVVAPPARGEEFAVEAARGALPDVERGAGAGIATAATTPEIDEALVKLREAEWIDRLTGVYALQRMGADAAPAAPALVAGLADDNGLVRTESAEALYRIGAPSVDLLVAQVASPRPEVRLLAVETLGRIGLPAAAAVPALRAATTDDDADVRDAATFAVSVVQPADVKQWLLKIAYEIGDEPYGIPVVVAAFTAISLIGGARSMLRSFRRRRAASVVTTGSDVASTPPDLEDDADDEDADEAADADFSPQDAPVTASPSSARAGSSGARADVVAPQGLAFAGAGLVAMSVGILVAVLATFTERGVEERHGVYHFAGLFFLFGYLFTKLGLKGAWVARQARRRREANTERWLRDRAWSRDGTGPIRSERVLPNLLALLLWVAFLLPFHTVWRLPLAYWGVWIVLAIFDLIGVAILVAVLRRIWRRLRAGRAFLRWQGVPVRPGGTFSARFETAKRLGGGPPLEAKLRCLRDRSENPVIGDEPAADAEEVYVAEKTFPLHDRPEGGSWAQLSFAVPADARGTDAYSGRPVRWVVTVGLPTAGPDFRTTFPVPIYR